jgi:phosphatidylglycerol:prolipoprotein diacylglycerol transferase
VHEIAFKIGGWEIHWYGILVAAAFLSAVWTATRRGLRDNFSPDAVLDAGFWILLGAIVGARVLFVITYWDEQIAQHPLREVIFNRSGFVFYGGLVGAFLAGLGYVLWKRLPVWRFADVMAPSIPLGHAFGRLGCLMTGCCYGRACNPNLPWAIHFPEGHPTHPTGQTGVPVHPTQLYEALGNLLLYAGLAWLFRRKHFPGQVFATYLVCYAILRSVVEMFRGDYGLHYVGGWITPAHGVSVFIFLAGVALWITLSRTQPVRSEPSKP